MELRERLCPAERLVRSIILTQADLDQPADLIAWLGLRFQSLYDGVLVVLTSEGSCSARVGWGLAEDEAGMLLVASPAAAARWVETQAEQSGQG